MRGFIFFKKEIIGAMHNIEGRIAFMRNKVEYRKKKMGKIKYHACIERNLNIL